MKSKRKAAGSAGRRERREFSTEFKAEAVRMAAERRAAGSTLADVGRELDVTPNQLREWRLRQRGAPRVGAAEPGETVEQENRRLRRENATLRQERPSQKKWRCTSRKSRVGRSARYAVITRHRREFEVRLMCRVLEVSPSGYYASLQRPASWHAIVDELLMSHVRIAHAASAATYGAPRVQRELRAEGLPVSTKRVARLMREDGLVARPRTAQRVSTTDSNHAEPTEPIAPNRLARQFDVNGVAGLMAVNRVWVSDITYITYIPTREGWLYLATVLDLGSRRCVGWAMRDDMELELALSALRMAREARHPAPGLIHHSDRGSVYAAKAYRAELAAHGMLASMSRKGNCYDNAVAESFFATLEFELLMPHDWHTRAEARRAIFRYIETWYNPRRRHSTLGYISPAEYEAQLVEAA
ncbi:MAG: IS3 family transposase [Sciscionella sp.]